jgi:hypothetical protein
MELAANQVMAKFSNRKFMRLTRLDWQGHPILRKRRAIPAPPVKELPPVEPLTLSTAEQDTLPNHQLSADWQDLSADRQDEAATGVGDTLINPDDFA